MGSYRTYPSLVKLQPGFLSLRWKTCLWAGLQPWFLSLQWRTCPWTEYSDDDDDDLSKCVSKVLKDHFLHFVEIRSLRITVIRFNLAGSLYSQSPELPMWWDLHIGVMRKDQYPFLGLNLLPPVSFGSFTASLYRRKEQSHSWAGTSLGCFRDLDALFSPRLQYS